MSTTRLNMLDEYGSKRRIMPAEVTGRFRKRRNYVHFILLIIFLILPWLQVNGTQAILFDISNRRFEFFGMIFFSHDSPLLFFVFAIVVLGIMLTTALWGRVWCGWACPQTVFIDAVFRRIEFWVEGNYIQQRRLYQSSLTFEKLRKFALKWFLFFIVSSLFAHSFIAYFTGGQKLLKMMNGAPAENWNYFLIVSCVTGLVLFNFGWFREQFCIIMCPYGRFQSVLLDQQSLNIVYDQARGEPRKGTPPAGQKVGDCVSCNRCVEVCPTAIDIRDGVQMECIGCTACIDACDAIMKKVNKPIGLIAYSTGSTITKKINYLRPRVLGYLALIVFCTGGLAYNIKNRQSFSVAVLRGKDAPYTVSNDGSIINHFKIHLHNQSHQVEIFAISLAVEGNPLETIKLTQASDKYELASGESKEVHLFVTFPSSLLDERGQKLFKLNVLELTSKENRILKLTAVGPY